MQNMNERIENRVSLTLAQTVAVLWKKSCEADGIAPESKFVVFSDGNRFAKLYNVAMGQLLDARAAQS